MVISDLLLGWLHEDGYSLGESGWVNPLTGKWWWQVEATKDGHQHFGPKPENTPIGTPPVRRSVRPPGTRHEWKATDGDGGLEEPLVIVCLQFADEGLAVVVLHDFAGLILLDRLFWCRLRAKHNSYI